MIKVIKDGTELIENFISMKDPKLKETRKITRANRKRFIKTKPKWFRQIMDYKGKRGRPSNKYKLKGD